MSKIWYKLIIISFFASSAFAEVCNEKTMDAFAYEDCIASQQAANAGNDEPVAAGPTYNPFNRDAYLTSSFGENRGTRYHAGFDYSTNMEEGWVVYAPENGKVEELRVSPFGYGKLMLFKWP